MYEITRQKTVPNVFIGGKHIGGANDVMKDNQSGNLIKWIQNAIPDYE
jgi:glutaredoxin